MASVLDIGIVGALMPIFIFLFIFAVVYAVLDKFKLMGDNNLVKLTVSFAIGMLFLFSDSAMEFVKFLTPWFVVFLIFGALIVGLFLFLGVREKTMVSALENPTVYWSVIILVILLLLFAISHVFSTAFSPYGGEGEKTPTSEGLKAIVHPRVLGALFLLVIAALAVRLVGQKL